MNVRSPDLARLRKEARAWLEANAPAAPAFRLPDSFMEVGTDEQFAFLRDWQRKVYDAGYLGMAWPAEYGGGGLPQACQDVVNDEMARARVPFMVNIIGLMWAGPAILKLGSDEQKRRYIRKILTAEEIWCQGFSEPNHGSDLASAETTAVRDGDSYVLNGTKTWTSLGRYARHMILLARTDPKAPRYQGLSFFLAPMDVPGVETRKIRKMTGEHGFTETRFEDARVSVPCRLGEEGEGWKVAMQVLAFERGAEGGQAGGQSVVVIRVDEVIRLAREVMRDGRPAIEDPVVRDRLVGFLIEERALSLGSARMCHPSLVSDRPYAIPMMGKLCFSEFRRRLCAFAVTLQGANGALYVDDPEAIAGGSWQRSYMNAFSATIGGGTSQIQKNIIGERILGLAKG